jgi:hypothetical protein
MQRTRRYGAQSSALARQRIVQATRDAVAQARAEVVAYLADEDAAPLPLSPRSRAPLDLDDTQPVLGDDSNLDDVLLRAATSPLPVSEGATSHAHLVSLDTRSDLFQVLAPRPGRALGRAIRWVLGSTWLYARSLGIGVHTSTFNPARCISEEAAARMADGVVAYVLDRYAMLFPRYNHGARNALVLGAFVRALVDECNRPGGHDLCVPPALEMILSVQLPAASPDTSVAAIHNYTGRTGMAIARGHAGALPRRAGAPAERPLNPASGMPLQA